jgi:hypothetical protein
MAAHEVLDRFRAIKGTLPGPSRTITVEPIRVPRAPTIVPRVPREHEEPGRKEPDPSRKPIPA